MVLILTLIAVVIVAVVFESCVVRRSEPLTGKAFTTISSNIANGEQVFMRHCQKCHPAGESGLGPTINGTPAPGFVKRFQVRHGLGVMPAFSRNEISKADLHDITAYLKAWKNY